MRIRTFLKPLSFLPAILLMYMIFSFSSMEADLSTSVSYKASQVLVKAADSLFDMGLDDYQIEYFSTKINGVTRKLAHMAEFFALAISVSFPLYVYGLRGILLMILAGGFCVAFACGDEYHQSFVAGRSPSSKDVLIDSIGVFIGIIVVRIIGWTGRMTLFRAPKEEAASQMPPQMRQFQQMPPFQQMPQMSRKELKQRKKQMKDMKKAGIPYQDGPYPQEPYYNPYYQPGYNGSDAQANGSYPEGFEQGTYQNGPYPNAPYGAPYNGPYPNNPYPQGPYSQGPYPYQPQSPQYMGYPEENHSSDELAEDMPLSHLLKPKK